MFARAGRPPATCGGGRDTCAEWTDIGICIACIRTLDRTSIVLLLLLCHDTIGAAHSIEVCWIFTFSFLADVKEHDSEVSATEGGAAGDEDELEPGGADISPRQRCPWLSDSVTISPLALSYTVTGSTDDFLSRQKRFLRVIQTSSGGGFRPRQDRGKRNRKSRTELQTV